MKPQTHYFIGCMIFVLNLTGMLVYITTSDVHLSVINFLGALIVLFGIKNCEKWYKGE